MTNLIFLRFHLQDWQRWIDFTHDLPVTYPEWIPVDTRLTVPSVWPDMVTFHGGPIACHA